MAGDTSIGTNVRRIRRWRGLSLEAAAELAGMSKANLSRIENGHQAVDRRSTLAAIANALQIAPQDLTALPVPAPGNGGVDSSIGEMRRALMAVSAGYPGGEVQPVEQLRARVLDLHAPGRESRLKEIGATLPGLVRDMHASIDAGKDVAKLLELAVLLHTQDTKWWLAMHGAPLDLRWQAAALAQQAAQRRDDVTARGIAAWGMVIDMLACGAFDLAATELNSVDVPTNGDDSMQLAGMLALSRSLVAAADSRPGDVDASLEYATELAERTGQGNAYWLGFGPTNVGLWWMAASLENGDHEHAAGIAESLNPAEHPDTERQAAYWVDYGRALARMRGRRDDAVDALRTAEKLLPVRVIRNPFARETVAELIRRARKDAGGRELRGLAYRMGVTQN